MRAEDACAGYAQASNRLRYRYTHLLTLIYSIALVVWSGPAPGASSAAAAVDAAMTTTTLTGTLAQRIDLALVGGTLIDGRGGPPLKNAVVTIRSDHIVAVGRVGEVPIPPGTPTRDMRGTS